MGVVDDMNGVAPGRATCHRCARWSSTSRTPLASPTPSTPARAPAPPPDPASPTGAEHKLLGLGSATWEPAWNDSAESVTNRDRIVRTPFLTPKGAQGCGSSSPATATARSARAVSSFLAATVSRELDANMRKFFVISHQSTSTLDIGCASRSYPSSLDPRFPPCSFSAVFLLSPPQPFRLPGPWL
eukprot:1747369-Rhodomonas_salina.1